MLKLIKNAFVVMMLALFGVMAGCGGGGSSSSSSSTSVSGVATPSNISVVTATNAN